MLFWCASKSSTFVDETAPQLTPHNHVKWKLAVANDVELNTRLLYIWLSLATDEFIIFYIYHIFMAYHSQVPSLHSYVNQSTTDTEIFFSWPRAAGHDRAMANALLQSEHTQFCRFRSRSWVWINTYPIGSMYGIYANIWGILMVNVAIYSIHGSYGY